MQPAFQERNTVSLPSLFNSSQVSLQCCCLLPAVDRSLLVVDIVRDDSAYDFDRYEFQARTRHRRKLYVLIVWSLISLDSYTKKASPGHDRVTCRDRNSFTHLQLRQLGDEHGYHPDLIPSRTVSTSKPHRPISERLECVFEPDPPREDRVPFLVQRLFHISKSSTNRGRKPNSLGSTPPRAARIPHSRGLITDLFELHSAVLGV